MIIMIALLLGTLQSSDRKVQPVQHLASDTDTSYLSCTVWTGKEWSKPVARTAKTPVLESTTGLRAYGEVQVAVNGDRCENTTTLVVSKVSGEDSKIVFTRTSEDSPGNGIRLVGWSPNGSKLLIEVTTWKYNTNPRYEYLPVVYDVSIDSATEISALEKAFAKYFNTGCEFQFSVRSWVNEQQVVVKISHTPESHDYEQHFCVDRPRLLVYDLQKDKVQTMQSVSKLQSQLAPASVGEQQDPPWRPRR